MNKTIWTGYCFIDTHFQSQHEKQCIENYCDSQMQADPLTDGKHDAELPILNHEDYFLTSLECQLLVFKDEWINTAQMFKHRVETYVQVTRLRVSNTTNSSTS
jgi:predicted XRE-type DNA-binding protein